MRLTTALYDLQLEKEFGLKLETMRTPSDITENFVDWILTIPDVAVREHVLCRNLIELLVMRKSAITSRFKPEDIIHTGLGVTRRQEPGQDYPTGDEQSALTIADYAESAFSDIATLLSRYGYKMPKESIELIYKNGRKFWKDFPAEGDPMGFFMLERWLTRDAPHDSPITPFYWEDKKSKKKPSERVSEVFAEGKRQADLNNKPKLPGAQANDIWDALHEAKYFTCDNTYRKDFAWWFSSRLTPKDTPRTVPFAGDAADLARLCRYITAISKGVPSKDMYNGKEIRMSWEFFLEVFAIADSRSKKGIISTMKNTAPSKTGSDLESIMSVFLTKTMEKKQGTIARQ